MKKNMGFFPSLFSLQHYSITTTTIHPESLVEQFKLGYFGRHGKMTTEELQRKSPISQPVFSGR